MKALPELINWLEKKLSNQNAEVLTDLPLKSIPKKLTNLVSTSASKFSIEKADVWKEIFVLAKNWGKKELEKEQKVKKESELKTEEDVAKLIDEMAEENESWIPAQGEALGIGERILSDNIEGTVTDVGNDKIQVTNMKGDQFELPMNKVDSIWKGESVSTGEWGLRWREFDRDNHVVNKEKIFSSEDARTRFIAKLQDSSKFDSIVSYSSPLQRESKLAVPFIKWADKAQWNSKGLKAFKKENNTGAKSIRYVRPSKRNSVQGMSLMRQNFNYTTENKFIPGDSVMIDLDGILSEGIYVDAQGDIAQVDCQGELKELKLKTLTKLNDDTQVSIQKEEDISGMLDELVKNEVLNDIKVESDGKNSWKVALGDMVWYYDDGAEAEAKKRDLWGATLYRWATRRDGTGPTWIEQTRM